MCSAFNLQAG